MTDRSPRGGEHTPVELKRINAAERRRVPFLIWRGADGELEITHLDDRRWRVSVGRAPDADVALTHDPQVSWTHAVIERVGGEWALIDDGLSRNGSYANGARVLGRHRLNNRDRLCFGSTAVIYRAAGGARAGAATASVVDNPAALSLSPMQRQILIALCRPVHDSEAATPATNREIAEAVNLSVEAVKAHLRVLFERFSLSALPQNEKRAQLVAKALVSGVLSPRDF